MDLAWCGVADFRPLPSLVRSPFRKEEQALGSCSGSFDPPLSPLLVVPSFFALRLLCKLDEAPPILEKKKQESPAAGGEKN